MNLEVIAKRIFEAAQREGVETMACFETWGQLTEEGRESYRRIAAYALASDSAHNETGEQ